MGAIAVRTCSINDSIKPLPRPFPSTGQGKMGRPISAANVRACCC
jgi:hypothetical protein